MSFIFFVIEKVLLTEKYRESRTKTRLTTMVGSIKHTEEEVVHDQWADIQAEIHRRGFSEWEKKLVAFYTKSTQRNSQVRPDENIDIS